MVKIRQNFEFFVPKVPFSKLLLVSTTLQIYIAYTCSGLVNCWMGGLLLSGLAKSTPPILILAKICYPSAQMI